MTLARRLILAAASIRNRHILDEDDAMLARTVTLSTADLLALDSTPVAVIPAPGPGKIAVLCAPPVGVSNAAAVPLQDGGLMKLRYAGTSVYLFYNATGEDDGFAAGLVTNNGAGSNDAQFGTGGSISGIDGAGVDAYASVSSCENAAIELTCSAPFTDPGDADSTLTVTAFYVIVDVPS